MRGDPTIAACNQIRTHAPAAPADNQPRPRLHHRRASGWGRPRRARITLANRPDTPQASACLWSYACVAIRPLPPATKSEPTPPPRPLTTRPVAAAPADNQARRRRAR
ncbi:hypothetical protein GCM10009554_36310 [Kribbella koreensis]|uniref:Uncharacterized protein n=1 Tax=Kribbella koreensis TaxID=57909 RepID=A0ABP4AYE4_9ACTN